MNSIQRFNSVLYGISANLRPILERIPDDVKYSTEEIRLRRNLPLTLTVEGKTAFVKYDGKISFVRTDNAVSVADSDILESFKLLCNSSVYAHEEELKNGFIMLKYGHRAGICGTMTGAGNLSNVTSVNIRIAKEIFGAADNIAETYDGGGLLIAGPPGSGKTTVLRDLIRQLSDGKRGKFYRVTVVDSRGEISGPSNSGTVNDLGADSDILMISDKAKGVEMAVRTMYPEIIAFDEIGTREELKGISESFSAGVSVITTAHIGDEKDLFKRQIVSSLINSGAISKIVILPKIRGDKIKIISSEELLYDSAV